jgi:hypothetical protein
MIKFKSREDLAYDAFYSCHVLGCEVEAEKIYATHSSIIDVCSSHHKELIEKDYQLSLIHI